ncbi:MAG TPA: VOC family protein [Marmoricola sp.]|jgi:catechol 2,3-dioxygenase-like lactoylglutathione lyase family enzyme|nr:VOC family protein [Marmoricola sp.]
MELHLFAGIAVTDYQRSLDWYERFLGAPPTMIPNEVEAVWDIAERRAVYIVVSPEDAGHARVTLFVNDDDFDTLGEQIASRGIEPEQVETYSNGVRKATYADPDGNELGIGGGPMG